MTLKETNVVTEPAASAADINATRNVIYFPDTSIDIEKLTRVDKDKCELLKKFIQSHFHATTYTF